MQHSKQQHTATSQSMKLYVLADPDGKEIALERLLASKPMSIFWDDGYKKAAKKASGNQWYFSYDVEGEHKFKSVLDSLIDAASESEVSIIIRSSAHNKPTYEIKIKRSAEKKIVGKVRKVSAGLRHRDVTFMLWEEGGEMVLPFGIGTCEVSDCHIAIEIKRIDQRGDMVANELYTVFDKALSALCDGWAHLVQLP